ncbi:MAG: aldo/keto reductase [Anaerolineales bacterium]|nr:aldo/keto reductase [Anaerolineales bacterium]
MKRTLGRSGIEVSALGLGCWAIGGPWQFQDGPGGWGEVDDAESIRAIHAGLAHGVNFFDTAANYGAGHSERILGQALAGRRQDAVIATKFGFVVDEAGKQVKRFAKDDDVIIDIRLACEASLQRLGTDYIDLYQFHVWDYPAEPAVEVREVLEALVSEGKIRSYGWSTDSVELAQVFAEGEHCTAVQHDLNVVMDAAEMLALCEKYDLASVNRSPLARGALTGKYGKDTVFANNDVRRDVWSIEHFFTPTLDKLEMLHTILTSGGRTLTQGALAWVLSRSPKTIPIPGFRAVKQVEENAKTLELGLFTEEQMAQIDSLLGRGKS